MKTRDPSINQYTSVCSCCVIDEGNWIAYRAVLVLLLCAVIGAGRMKTRDPSINQYTSACAVVVCVCVCLYKV